MFDILTLAAARKYTDSAATSLEEKIEDMSALKFKGVKEHISDLPLTGEIGDFWLVEEDSKEYFWTGSKWEDFGGVISSEGNNMSFKIVSALPTTSIDESTYYLTKATRPTYNYGNYCSNKVRYLSDNLPSLGANLLIYNSADGLFYKVGASFTDLKVEGGWLYFKSSSYQYVYMYKLVNGAWVRTGATDASTNAWKSICSVSSTNKFKFLYVSGDKNFTSDGNTYIVTNDSTKDGETGYIYADFYETTGEYKNNDFDNVDEDNIFIYNMNLYSNNSWSIVGQFDIQELIEPISTTLATKADSPLVFNNLSIATTDWVVDATYSNYGYKATLTCQGVTADMIADVYFNGESAILGTLAPFCETGTNTVTVYCSANDTAVTVDRVVVQ